MRAHEKDVVTRRCATADRLDVNVNFKKGNDELPSHI